ncbi:CLUMA_CG001438, isoform A [Clunio marinus]|uniref:CLUMA_CG001438, isoform A n=1 Tax=Clunio marinus TaxID=568069 RepID=A0A1J1HJA4_9DIPT|nr:CLUMA_CG001438, isoform A [Clunio marinus]
MRGINASKFLIIFAFYCVLDISFAKRVITFNSVSCLSSNKSLVFFECFVKPITDDIATLNVVIHFLKTVPDISFAYDVTLKAANRGFRSLVNGKDIDMCKYLDGSKKSIALNYGLNLVRKHFPEGSLHPCPYKAGTIELKNILSGSSETKMTVFPPAMYMIKLKYYNKEDDNIASLNVTCTSKDI